MIYSLEEIESITLDFLDKYNNNELYYINMDNKLILMLLEYLNGRCNYSDEEKEKFSPLYDYLSQSMLYRDFSADDIAYLVDVLLIDNKTHEVVSFINIVCSWNNLGKKVLDYMYDKGYFEEMGKISNPLIFEYPSEKESYAKKISSRITSYNFFNEKYSIKNAVFVIASGVDNDRVITYLETLLYKKQFDKLYLLYFFRDTLLDDNERRSFDLNIRKIFSDESIDTIKQNVSSIKNDRCKQISKMLESGDFSSFINDYGYDEVPISNEEIIYYFDDGLNSNSRFKDLFWGSKSNDRSTFIENFLNEKYVKVPESVLFTPFYGYYRYKNIRYYCNGKNAIELLFKHKKTNFIDNLIENIKHSNNIVAIFDLYRKYNFTLPWKQLRIKIVFDIEHCLTDDVVNELAYDYRQSCLYSKNMFLHVVTLFDVSVLEKLQIIFKEFVNARKNRNIKDVFNTLFLKPPKIKTIKKYDKKKISQNITVAQISRRYVKSYDDNYGSDVILSEEYEALLNELKDLFVNDGKSDKKLVQYLVNSYRYALSENADRELNAVFACEIRSLIEIKKTQDVHIYSALFVNGTSYFSNINNCIYINSAYISSKAHSLIHEIGHLLHFNNCNGDFKVPDEFSEMSNLLIHDKNFKNRIKQFAKIYELRKKKIKESVSKIIKGKDIGTLPDKNTLIELMKKSSLSDDEINTLLENNALENIFSGNLLANKKKSIMIKELEAVLNSIEMDTFYSISDLLDAILCGTLFDDGINRGLSKNISFRGHGGEYYSNNEQRFAEMIANYGCILKSKEQVSGIKPTPLDILTHLVGEDYVKMIDDFYKEYIAHYYDRRDNVNERK